MGKRDRYKLQENNFFKIDGLSDVEGGVSIPLDIFEMLESFVYDKKMPDPRGINSYMLSVEGEGNNRVLRAGGYVGALVFKDGTQI